MCIAKRFGLPRDVAKMIGDMLKKPWTEWKTWFPLRNVSMYVPLNETQLLSRFCCDEHDDCVIPHEETRWRIRRHCYCSPETWARLVEVSFRQEGRTTVNIRCRVLRDYNSVKIVYE